MSFHRYVAHIRESLQGNRTARRTNKGRQQPRVTFFRPRLERLEDRTLLSIGQQVVTALDSALPGLNTALTKGVFGVEIPIVGSALKNTNIANSIAGLDNQLDNNDSTLVKETDITKVASELTKALGSPYTVTAAQQNNGDYKFTLSRKDTLATINSGSFNFDVGLPGLGLKTTSGPGGLTIQLQDQLNLSFVVPNGGGPIYFTATGGGNHDFSLSAKLSIPNFNATATLGLFQVKVEEDKADNPSNDLNNSQNLPQQGASSFNPTFNYDLPSGQVTPSNVLDGTPSLTGAAAVHLAMEVSFGGNKQFPSFKTNFDLEWPLDTSNTTQGPLGSKPTVEFKNVQVDAGSYFNDFLDPILQKIQTVTRPLQPLIDVLETPVPVISDLLGHKETFLDLVSLLAGNSNSDTVSFIKSVAQIISLVNSVPTDPGLTNIVVPFGDFDLSNLTDVRNDTSTDLTNLDLSSLSNPSFFKNLINTFQGDGGLNATVANFLSQAEGGTGSGENFSASFPILDDPMNVFGLFLGKPVDLFDLTLPDLTFSGGFDQFFPIIGPLGVDLKGNVGATFHLQVGYDTYGLSTGDPLQGFFVSDSSFAQVSAGIHAYAALDVVVASAGVGGGIDATIKFTPNDPDHDGKLRPSEIIDDLKMGPFCIFNTSGSITAGLDAFVKVGFDTPFGFVGWQDDWSIAKVTLLDFSSGCMNGINGNMQPTLGHISTGSGEDKGIPAGYLILNMGPFAGDRKVGDTTDDDETFTVSHIGGAAGDETVQIDSQATTQTLSHIKGIYAEGGDGNNIITIKSGVVSPVILYGGFNNALHPGPHNPPGHNQLYSADGPATLYAGDGGDEIVAGSGDANIYGGAGNDNLVGGTGHCYIKAGSGHSKLTGGGGVSTLDGNDGASDIETAGSGDDTLIGGTGGNNTYIINNPYDPSNPTAPSGKILTSAGQGIRIFGHGASNQLILDKGGGAGFTETYNYGPGNGDGIITTTNGAASQTVTFTSLGGPIFDTVTTDSVAVNGSSSPNTIQVIDGNFAYGASPTNPPTQTQATAHNLTGFNIDSFAPTFLANKATMNLYSQGGGDTVLLDNPTPADELTNLNVYLGKGINMVNVAATGTGVTTTIDGTLSQTNTYNVGLYFLQSPNGSYFSSSLPYGSTVLDYPSLNGVQGALIVKGSGSDSMNDNDSGPASDRSGKLTTTTLTGLGMGPSGITFSGLIKLNLSVGPGASATDTFDITDAVVRSLVTGPTYALFDQNPVGKLSVTYDIGSVHVNTGTPGSFVGPLATLTLFEGYSPWVLHEVIDPPANNNGSSGSGKPTPNPTTPNSGNSSGPQTPATPSGTGSNGGSVPTDPPVTTTAPSTGTQGNTTTTPALPPGNTITAPVNEQPEPTAGESPVADNGPVTTASAPPSGGSFATPNASAAPAPDLPPLLALFEQELQWVETEWAELESVWLQILSNYETFLFHR